jgi:c-di-GMP-binding flagellar brake protein YcgR
MVPRRVGAKTGGLNLFSRKDNDPFMVSVEQVRRDSFRVEPSSRESLWISINHHRYRVKNIGAGGIGVYRKSAEIPIEIGKTYPFQITLPLLKEAIEGTVKVLNISRGVYHCTFIALSEEKKEKLHLFVLERQKEQLRKEKRS